MSSFVREGMALTGKLEVENEIPIPASEFFHIFTKKLQNLQNITDHVHKAELHEGEAWHTIGSIKQWSFTLFTFDLFEGDIQEQYKSLKVVLKGSNKEGGRGGGGVVAKWIIEYEKLNEGILDPTAYLKLVTNVCKDVHAVVPSP